MIRTICVVAGIYHSGADAHEEDAFLLILSAELGGHDVHGAFGHGVQWTRFNVPLIYPLDISHAGGKVDDLLDLALFDERNEGLVEVNVAHAVDLKELHRDFFHLLWRSSLVRCRLVSEYPTRPRGCDEIQQIDLQRTNGLEAVV